MKELINETVALYTKTKNNKCICDECGDEVDSSWGDVRKEVFRFDSKDQKVPSSIRMVCPSCIEDLFGGSFT